MTSTKTPSNPDRAARRFSVRAFLFVFLTTAVTLVLGAPGCFTEPASPEAVSPPSPGGSAGSEAPSAEGTPTESAEGTPAPWAEGTPTESAEGTPTRSAEGTLAPSAEGTPEPAAAEDDPTTETPVPTVAGEDERLPKISAVVEIDERVGELGVPCLFVNPSQALEVFGCHWFGPAHETVVAYLAEGKAIYDGLVRLGLRSPKFWNASSRVAEGRPDVRYTLGDRVVAFLRWERQGKPHFLPAEKILREIGTGFSPFVRGFTFSGQEVLLGDPPSPGIPSHVEITIGGPTRGEKAVTSILFHPNDLRELTRWMAPLEIDSRALPDLTELVDEEVHCTLVLRKVGGEAALLDLALEYETDAGRHAFLESLRPIAEEIDLRKDAHARMVQRILDLTARGEEALEDPGAREKVEEELLGLIQGGRLERDVIGIWQLYLKLFLAQEAFRKRVLEKDESLDELVLEQVRRLHERLSFEPRFVDLELQILNLRSQETPLSEKNRLLVEALGFELDQRRHEGELPLAQLNLKDISRRLSQLDPNEDAWSFQVQEEYRREIVAGIRHLKSRARELSTRARENRARAEGDWAALRDEVLQERTRALAGVTLAEREVELVEVDRDLRWSSHDVDSDRIPDEKKIEIREKIDQLKERRESLLKEVEAKRKEVETEPD